MRHTCLPHTLTYAYGNATRVNFLQILFLDRAGSTPQKTLIYQHLPLGRVFMKVQVVKYWDEILAMEEVQGDSEHSDHLAAFLKMKSNGVNNETGSI